ncbi:MAG TPA: DUF3592 domain-containing protein [Pyrinomonadaceae bacterium]|jgi:uncharacterized membrane protein
MDKLFFVVGVLVFLLGLAFAIVNAALFLRKVWKVLRAIKTTGVVTNVEAREGMRHSGAFASPSPRNTLFRPTVRFQTADGRVIDYTPGTSNSWSNYKIGENIPVYYDARQPQKPVVGRFYNLWFPFFLFGFVSALLIVVGGIFSIVGRGMSP